MSAPPERFMYHSFPRRGAGDSSLEIDKGLRILGGICTIGLLLTPEIVDWPGEFKPGGSSERGEPFKSYVRRACFTELAPNELKTHAQRFGSFAIEFEIATLRD